MQKETMAIIILAALLVVSFSYSMYLSSQIRTMGIYMEIEGFLCELDRDYYSATIAQLQNDIALKSNDTGIQLYYSDTIFALKGLEDYGYNGKYTAIGITNPFEQAEKFTLFSEFLNASTPEGTPFEPIYEDPETLIIFQKEPEVVSVNEKVFWDIAAQATGKTTEGTYYYRLFACYGETDSCDEDSANLFDYLDIKVVIVALEPEAYELLASIQ